MMYAIWIHANCWDSQGIWLCPRDDKGISKWCGLDSWYCCMRTAKRHTWPKWKVVWCQRCRTQSHEASAAKACSPFNGIMRGLAKRVAAIKASSQKLPTHLRCALFKSTASTPWPILLRLLLGILTSKVLGARSRGLVDYIASQAWIYMGNCSTPESEVDAVIWGGMTSAIWHEAVQEQAGWRRSTMWWRAIEKTATISFKSKCSVARKKRRACNRVLYVK